MLVMSGRPMLRMKSISIRDGAWIWEQYSSWVGIEPPVENWDSQVMDGKGLFYGLEADATYRTNHLTLSGSYTLSWNKRKYDDFYPDWYYDKFDNRHKLNLSLRYEFNKKVSCYAVWNYHTGNHATVPTQLVALPGLPDGEGKYLGSWWGSASYVYAIPNNLTLPAYHRLDLGFLLVLMAVGAYTLLMPRTIVLKAEGQVMAYDLPDGTHATLSPFSSLSDGTPLSEVLEDLSKLSGVKYTASDESKRLTGDFDTDSIPQVIQVIEETLGVTIR